MEGDWVVGIDFLDRGTVLFVRENFQTDNEGVCKELGDGRVRVGMVIGGTQRLSDCGTGSGEEGNSFLGARRRHDGGGGEMTMTGCRSRAAYLWMRAKRP